MTDVPPRPPWLVELPLSALQQRMWFLCTSWTGTSSTLIGLVYRLRGPIDVTALERAVGAVVDRHESLRTRFVNRPGGPVQVIDPPGGLPVEHIDLGDLPEHDREGHARTLVTSYLQALLDLEKGPLISSYLIRLADDDHVWCTTIHHILADGASVAIVERELGVLYNAFAAGTDPGLPELPLQYGDFAVWQNTTRAAEEADDLAYWQELLAGVPVLDLPTDFARPAEKGTRAAEVARHLDPDLTAALDGLARTERCTLFMILLAALEAVLADRSGQQDFCIGTPVVGRTLAELTPVVGLLANMVALRADLSGDPTFHDLLMRTRDTVLDALDRQDVPFGRVVAALGVPRDPARTQVFQVIYTLDEFEAKGGLALSGVRVEPFSSQGPQVLHDVVVDVWRSAGGRLSMKFRYDTALFTSDTIADLGRRFETVLRGAVADPGARLSDLLREAG